MFSFAYDGSIHGDWVSHYAVRLAANHPEKELHLVHIRDGQTSEEELKEKFNRIRIECEPLVHRHHLGDRRADADRQRRRPPLTATLGPRRRLVPQHADPARRGHRNRLLSGYPLLPAAAKVSRNRPRRLAYLCTGLARHPNGFYSRSTEETAVGRSASHGNENDKIA